MPNVQRPPNRRELDARLDALEPEVVALAARVTALESSNAALAASLAAVTDRLRKIEGQQSRVIVK